MRLIQRSCLRKRRHTNYLTALHHASALHDDGMLVIYPCEFCGGLHVGHTRPAKMPVISPVIAMDCEELRKRIKRARRRVQSAITDLRAVVEPTQEAVERAKQRIRDRRRYLASLRQALSKNNTSIENNDRQLQHLGSRISMVA